MKRNEFEITIEIAANIRCKLVTTRHDECISEDLGACRSNTNDVDRFSSRLLSIQNFCDKSVVFVKLTFVPPQSDSRYRSMRKMIRIQFSQGTKIDELTPFIVPLKQKLFY